MDKPIKQAFFNAIAEEFDVHVRQSIPHFGDFIETLQDNIIRWSENHFDLEPKFVKAIDICGSTGLFGANLIGKGFQGSYFNIDGSPEMCKISNGFHKHFPNHLTMKAGFMSSWEDESGELIPEYDADGMVEDIVDVVTEILGFQFFTKDRGPQIRRVKKMLSPNGIAIFVEKFSNVNEDIWNRNEDLKDKLWKSKFFTDEEIAAKKRNVLKDMGEYCYEYGAFKNLLRANFTYVAQIYHAGNFAGYACSDKPFNYEGAAIFKDYCADSIRMQIANDLLENLGVYSKFEKACLNGSCYDNMIDAINGVYDLRHLITRSFTWAYTEDGYSFWLKVCQNAGIMLDEINY